MELGLVSAGSIYFIATVDEFVRFEPAPFENVESLVVAKEAVVCAEGLDGAEWVSLP